jgi:dihydrofolate reductase
MTVSVFVGTSADGFLARRDGTYDFLDPHGNEPHGFEEFFATIDTLVIGRGTFEIVAAFPEWPYGDRRVVALSSRPLDFSKIRNARLEQMAGEPAEILKKLEGEGTKHIYVDGGITIQRFLAAGLVNRLIVTRVPVLIGDGIPLFGPVPRDIQLTLVAVRHFKTGMVQAEYQII